MMTFDDFLEESFDRLAVYARLLTNNRHDGDDLLAESLLIAQRRWERIGRMEFPAAYVRRVISSRHLRERSRWFTRNVEPRAPESLPIGLAPDHMAVIDHRTTLAQYLKDLPVRHRAAVVMRYYLDLSYEEIGHELGISAGGARTLVFRGISGLRASGLIEQQTQETS